MAKSKIYIKPSKRGTFTRAAKQRDMGVQEFASQVLSNPENYSPAMKKKAQFAVNSTKFNKAMGGKVRKYGLGGDIFGGATSGIGAGAAFGPIGAGIGAVLGGISGLVGGKKREKAERRQRKLEADARDRELAFAEYEPTGQQYAGMFQDGGKVKGQPFESVITPVYKPVTSRTVYLEGKRQGLIPKNIKFKDFNSDPTPYLEGLGDSYKYDPETKTGVASGFSKRFEDIQEGVTGKNIKRKGQRFQDGGNVTRKVPRKVRVQDYTPFIEQEDRLNDVLVDRMEMLDRKAEQAALDARPIPRKVRVQDYTAFIEQEDKLNDALANRMEIQDRLAEENKFACGGRAMRKYPLGGLLPYDETMPIEAEGGESGVEPDGDQFNIQGPSHANGGVPMEAEVGTRIFSDRIKVPGSTKTFSEANKKLGKKISKYQETIDDPYSTKIAKRTAERMLSRLTAEQDELFNQQQSLNGDSNGETGTIPKAEDGILVEPWMTDLNSFGVDRMVAGTDYDQLLGDLQGDTNLADVGRTGAGKVLGTVSRGIQGFNQSGAGQALGGLAQAAPALMNIGEGLFGKVEQEDPSDYQNISGMAAASRLRNRRFNVDPQLAAVRSATATGRRNIQQGARTRGELLSNLGGLTAMEGRQTSDILAQKQNIENQMASEAAQMTSRLGSESAATRLNIARSNAASRAARRNILRTGVSQLGQLSQSRERTANLKEADRIRLAALNQYFPNYTLGEDYQFNIR